MILKILFFLILIGEVFLSHQKEKLDTGNATSELVLSILAANAQEEIISLSNNMKVGRRMRYAEGIVP